MAGYSNPSRSLYTIVKELIDNSLDSCESAKKFPDISLHINTENSEFVVISVIDNGTGISPADVPYVFGKIFYGSKFGYRQSRGALGMGVTMAILYSQISTNKAAEIITSFDGKSKYYFKIKIDIQNNEPIVEEKKILPNLDNWFGTSVTLYAKGDYSRARPKILEYIDLITLISPYVSLKFYENEILQLNYTRVVRKMPDFPTECKPHPHGIDFETFSRLAYKKSSKTVLDFLVRSFQKVGIMSAKKFLKFAGVESNKRICDFSSEDLYELFLNLSKYSFSSPDSKCLVPSGRDILLQSVIHRFEPKFAIYDVSESYVYSGHPFIIECILFWGGHVNPAAEPKLIRFANRVPLIYTQSEDVFYHTIKSLKYNRRIFKDQYPTFLFHICSTHVPFKDVEKTAIASVPEITDAAYAIASKCLSKLERKLQGSRSSEKSVKKQKMLLNYLKLSLKYAYFILNNEEPTESYLNKLLSNLGVENY